MNKHTEIRVWDPFVRVFHWGLAAAFFIAYLSGDAWLDLHTLAGYTALGLILARLPWGVIGTRHARFSDFVRPPRVALAYVRDLFLGRAKRHLGHNPAGGLMILALLVTLPLVALSGMALLSAEEGAGPLAGLMAGSPHWLAEGIEGLHEFLANLVLLMVGVHVLGVLVESLLHRENLIRAMFTGAKPARDDDEQDRPGPLHLN
ncbi:cytochrome B561 [Thioalkalivibrio sulfidiphilus HL-EbGr7]|uniref:Cytochrome B561 n=1 Tax=Thioalkalivibrio sulfidiphilus (strain HL-EbGR7) TaxID=396588 RepID=B8GLT0_THISH|nr:cytochrome b/b6 domain-containing protein [Thioalkalivibrio sulfidiphilus]ACL71683.1 cytochrome B561 [Thioalkalivibrio sulfidiphilus HL-EbGr7]